MKKHASWYAKAQAAQEHTLDEIEVEYKDGSVRMFNVTFDFVNYYVPAKNMHGRFEDAIPPEGEAYYEPNSLQITENMEDGTEVDVTDSLDEFSRGQIEAAVDRWVQESGQEAYSEGVESARDAYYEDLYEDRRSGWPW